MDDNLTTNNQYYATEVNGGGGNGSKIDTANTINGGLKKDNDGDGVNGTKDSDGEEIYNFGQSAMALVNVLTNLHSGHNAESS